MYNVVFDTQQINLLIKNFYTLTGISISFCSFDRKVRIFGKRSAANIDNDAFCNILRRDKNADCKCLESDRLAYRTACKNKGIYIYKCHAGLTEVIAPIIYEGKEIGYLITGKILDAAPDQEQWKKILNLCKQYDVDHEALEKAFFRLRYMNWDQIHAAAAILEMCSKYIYISRYAEIREPLFVESIKQYIENHISENVTVNQLSKHLNLSKSHLSHIIKAQFGMSLSAYILGRRIQISQDMLRSSTDSIKKIALDTGFSEQNYFSRIFKKETGFSPKEYREIHYSKN